jgi:uncharacterized coiled-coil protein SlyX
MKISIPVEAPELDTIIVQLATLTARLIDLDGRTAHMATLTQEQLDNLTTAITTAVANIRQDIADLRALVPNLDTSALDASVAALEALDAENPPPAV